jgi:spermidine/putrescine transport system permease protein
MKKNDARFKWLVLGPVIIYVLFLIVLPLLYILLLSFLSNDSYGGIITKFTLNNYFMIFDLVYVKVFLKSFLIAFITTFICILIAYPFSIFIKNKKPLTKTILVTLVIIPFFTNSLIRTYGWIVLLRKEGIINSLLISMHLINSPLQLMYNNQGIIIGMVYTLLPFMILPVQAAVDKIDPRVIEAAHDLGATKWQTFCNIIVPQTLSGLFNGSLMVFIPTIGYFFIADILGGGKEMLIGNLIRNQFLTARNWPFGSALAIFLIILTFVLVQIYKKTGGSMDDLGGF